ncbi:alpha/beta hydrolase family protein [Curvivirga sp.]|uniref:alpha/beta hydrolase family protein n=1 Tax=Curvivirga sp. TaxID=2856848 RepID=UPI003B5C1893
MAFRRIFGGLGWLFIVVAILSFFYEWDTSRIYYKKLRAKSAYLYEEINPRYLEIDPRDYLQDKNVSSIRAALLSAVMGDRDIEKLWPIDVQNVPDASDFLECLQESKYRASTPCHKSRYEKWANLGKIQELIFETDFDLRTNAILFKPENFSGKMVIYHHGYAGTFHETHRHLEKLVAAGYLVLAFNTPLYGDVVRLGDNAFIPNIYKGTAPDDISYPTRFFFEPLFAGLNYVLSKEEIQQVNMIGLSNGGWATAVFSAMDPRIENSYPIAGVYPVYLRQLKESAPAQLKKNMLEAASYMDMFVLAADRSDRSQLQIFNKYDRCCYNNTRGKLYEDAVQEKLGLIGGGDFQVLIDTTHPRHKISHWAFDQVFAHMEARS